MPKINEDIVVKYEDESTHEIGQEASWSGFEVEVENDSNESTEQAKSTDSTEEVELVGSNNCINSQIVVECDDRHQRSTGNVISIVGNNHIIGCSTNNKILQPNLRKDVKALETEQTLRTAIKPPNISPSLRNNERVKNLKIEKGQKSVAVLGKTNVSTESIDEYSAFGLYVEQELKKITNPYALQVTKYKINQVLFEATTGAYHRGLDSSLKNQT